MKGEKVRQKTEQIKAKTAKSNSIAKIIKNLTSGAFFTLLGLISLKSPERIKEVVFLWILALLSIMVITKAAMHLRSLREISPNIDYYETFQD